MTLPGINYMKKPYCDIGDELPNVGARVVFLPFIGGIHIEGHVVEIDPAHRRVKVDAVKSLLGEAQESFTVWSDWKDWQLCP